MVGRSELANLDRTIGKSISQHMGKAMAQKHIPPVQCLVTFEAVSRLRHAGRAADELCVTTSAVSHRIRQLESFLGCKVFERSDFSLTSEGEAYLTNVRVGLTALQRVPEKSPTGFPRLRVAVTPTFARQMLMPRLELFRNAYPEIELTIQVAIPLMNVTAEKADLEVRFGPGGYLDVEYRKILDDEVVPACSPSYLNEFGPFGHFDADSEIGHVRLLRSPLEPWSTWFAAWNLTRVEPESGMQFNDLGLAYDAAASGYGVVLARQKLSNAWLDSGRLVRLSSRSVPSPHAYYLCWQPGMLERWECAAFADWIEQSLKEG